MTPHTHTQSESHKAIQAAKAIAAALLKDVELTHEQKIKWGTARSMVTFSCPGFRHLWYKMLNHKPGGGENEGVAVFTRRVPVAAVDKHNILINPDTFFSKYSPGEQLFILAHEIVHRILGDVELLARLMEDKELVYPDGKRLPFNWQLFQMALDYRLNPMLVDSKIGKLPEGCCYDRAIATAESTVYDVYRTLYDQNPPPPSKGKGKGEGEEGEGEGEGQDAGEATMPGNAPGTFDQVLPPGTSVNQSAHEANNDINEDQWRQEVKLAEDMEKSRGVLTKDLMLALSKITRPNVPWYEHIEGFMLKRFGAGASDWRRPDRRLLERDLYSPGRGGHGVEWLFILGDTSGSMMSELDLHLGHIMDVIEQLNPRRITAYWVDTEIKQHDEITDLADLERIAFRGIPGGGGTNFVQCFREMDAEVGRTGQYPDAFIGLTDGLARFPDTAPPFPCVWAVTTDAPIPFGEVVRVNPKELQNGY